MSSFLHTQRHLNTQTMQAFVRKCVNTKQIHIKVELQTTTPTISQIFCNLVYEVLVFVFEFPATYKLLPHVTILLLKL